MAQSYTLHPIRFRIGDPGSTARQAGSDAEGGARAVAAVMEALRTGDANRAAELAQAALDAGFEHPELLCVRAMALEAAGQPGDAVACLRRASALRPADVSIMNALARCLIAVERPKEALAAAQDALRLGPDYPDLHAQRGGALHQLGYLPDADRSYVEALKRDPQNLTALAGKATLCLQYGDHQGARVHAEAALRAAPGYPPAALILAEADLAQGNADRAESRIRALIAGGLSAPLLQSHLADALDGQDRVDEAFAAWTRAGDALRTAYADRFGGDGLLCAAEAVADGLDALPPAAWPRGEAAAPRAGATHLFLLGFARSGTSLMGLALDGHRDVELVEEQELLKDAIAHFAGPDGVQRLTAAGEAELDGLRSAYWRRARSAGAKLGRKVFVDKQPMNALHLHLIARLFPDAKVLFVRRDPRDIVFSCFRRRFSMNRYTYELLRLDDAARLYVAAMRTAVRVGELAPLDALAVRHEDLAAEFEREMRKVCGFLGLGWSDAIMTFPARVRAGAVTTPSGPQLARGLNSDGVGQWRRYARQLKPVLPHLAPWVERFGYPPDPAPAIEAPRAVSAAR